jgi:two-component system, sensor histidine kinase YesM
MPLREIDRFAPIVVTFVIYTYGTLFGTLALLIVVFYLRFYRPVTHLFAGMHRVESGDLSVSLPTGRKDEVGYIYDRFNKMVQSLKQLIDENYRIQLNKKDSQLKLLLSQINEHFLYNTLDCIHWLAQKGAVQDISDIVFRLSRFYSLSLSSGRDSIPVRDILAIIESYIYIQKLRKPGTFEYICHCDPSLEESLVSKYLFQPLVENALLHGIEDGMENGRIDVTFERRGALLRFEVKDNGRGIAPGRMREIQQCLVERSPTPDTAFALANINSQIKLLYGEGYGLSIESQEGVGTRVWMEIPVDGRQPPSDPAHPPRR